MNTRYLHRFFNMVFPIVLMVFSVSCSSIAIRGDARKMFPPPSRVYPGTQNNMRLIKDDGYFKGISKLCGTVDFPFSLVLDTLLFPTDLLFGPGAIIAEKPSAEVAARIATSIQAEKENGNSGPYPNKKFGTVSKQKKFGAVSKQMTFENTCPIPRDDVK